MKEVKKCSLSGLAFTLETDAYELLRGYLGELKKTYGADDEGREIVADIEARIAELILSAQTAERVVERPLIANIIAQLGTAEDISEESSADDAATKTPEGEPRIPRRLFRNTENAMLGGVCSGLARYFGVETAWVRLACFTPLLLLLVSSLPYMWWLGRFGQTLIWAVLAGYVIMWLVVPAARTARQKLEADGEHITVRAMRENSAAGRVKDVDRNAKPVVAETVAVLGRIVIFMLKLFATLCLFVLTVVALLLFVSLVLMFCIGGEMFDSMMPPWSAIGLFGGSVEWLAVLSIVAVLIPVIMLLYVLFSLVLNLKPNRIALFVGLLLWIPTLVAVPTVALRTFSRHIQHTGVSVIGYSSDDDEDAVSESIDDSTDASAEPFELPAPVERSTENYTDEYPSIDID